MPEIKVLVTGVGAIIGQGIVRSLRMSKLNIRITGVDADSRAVGFHFCDDWLVCPRADSDDFAGWIAETCDQMRIDLVLPGIPQDVEALAAQRHIETETRAKVVLNSPEAIRLGLDKWETFLFLRKHGLPVPTTALAAWITAERARNILGFPCLLKPRRGSASKGIVLVHDADEYDFFTKRRSDYIAQRLIGTDNEEYTCGIFGLGDGVCTDAIVMKRKSSSVSFTAEAVVDDYNDVRKVAIATAEATGAVGPTNIQIRKYNGIPMVLEINPRISSSTSLRAAFGFNEAEMCIQRFILGEVPHPVAKRGFAQRYVEDFIVSREG